MTDWKSRIRDAWKSMVPPGDHVLSEDALDVLARHPDSLPAIDALTTARWLAGKKWDDIASDDDRLDVEMPFFYLSDPACGYYLGGYLLHLTEAFEGEWISSLAPVHFAGFMGSGRFAAVLPGLSREQQSVLREFSAAMLEDVELFGLDANFSAKLRTGVRLLEAAPSSPTSW